VHIQGLGEPFLSKDLLPMIRYAKSLGLQTHMITNMTIMTPQLAEALVLSGHDMLAISLDSPDPAVVAHIRRGAHFDVFERILRNIRMVRDAQQRLGRQTPEMVIYAISLKATLPRMADFVAMCKDLGIRELCFQDLITQGIPDQACLPDGERLADQPLRSLSDAALKQAILEMKRHADDAVNIVPPHLFDNLILDKRFKNAVVSCLDLWERPAIGVDGTVTPCCFTLGAGTLDMGNILGQSFAEIWHGQRYQALRWAHITGRPPEICRNCTQMFQWLDAPAGNGEHRHGYAHCYRSFFMGDRRCSLRMNGQ
ncbi:MAG TPA: radical SAM protein, partial [Candidatus Hydrogenedentes bacterium]|nr:radical SAM protein [Candidatus Hydrogenedentota bacterium]